MTPFDPIALLAMLQAFYPVVGPAAFARARLERPEYFAAGTIIGTSGDALRLPDGRIFDCIFDVGNPQGLSRWQCIEDTGGGVPDTNPFRLEPGPLVPIDLSGFTPTNPTPVFLPLVTARLGELGDAEGVLITAHGEIAAHANSGPIQDAFASLIDPAVEQLAAEGFALDAADPTAILVVAGGQSRAVDAHAGEYGETPPPEI